MICMYSWSIQVYIILFSMFIYFNELMNRIVNCITVVHFSDRYSFTYNNIIVHNYYTVSLVTTFSVINFVKNSLSYVATW